MKPWCLLALLGIAVGASSARAQATGQLWTNVTIDWLPTNRLSYELDLEPKAQLIVHEGQPTFGE